MRTTLLTAALVAAAVAPTLGAQRTSVNGPTPIVGSGFEFRPLAGGLIPTGKERDLLKDAGSVGAQLGWRFNPAFALTGSFSWSPTKDRTTVSGLGGLQTGRQENVDLYQYDLGLEARIPIRATVGTWSLAPYAGLGIGGRTYNYRDVASLGAETNFLGYGALGLDIAPAAGPIGIRLEARDNVTAFKGLRGEYVDYTARNDVQLHAGLAWRF